MLHIALRKRLEKQCFSLAPHPQLCSSITVAFLMVGITTQAPGIIIHPKDTEFVGKVPQEQVRAGQGLEKSPAEPPLGCGSRTVSRSVPAPQRSEQNLGHRAHRARRCQCRFPEGALPLQAPWPRCHSLGCSLPSPPAQGWPSSAETIRQSPGSSCPITVCQALPPHLGSKGRLTPGEHLGLRHCLFPRHSQHLATAALSLWGEGKSQPKTKQFTQDQVTKLH